MTLIYSTYPGTQIPVLVSLWHTGPLALGGQEQWNAPGSDFKTKHTPPFWQGLERQGSERSRHVSVQKPLADPAVCFCTCATKWSSVLNRWGGGRELLEAESVLPSMSAWHATSPDVHVHTVFWSVCQRWPSATSRPSHTHFCLTHSHPSRYCTRNCRSAFLRE